MSESDAPRVEVDHERSEHERCREQRPLPGGELPLTGEVGGKKRQHDQTRVPRQPGWLVVVGEPGSESCDLDRDRRSHREGERLEPGAGRARRLVVIASEELFPESAAVLARELSGQVVDVPQPLHGDQEPLIRREAGRVQLGDLVTKMVLQLIDVVAVDARRSSDVGPPLCDL